VQVAFQPRNGIVKIMKPELKNVSATESKTT